MIVLFSGRDVGTMTTKCPEEGEIIANVSIGIQANPPNSKHNMWRHACITKAHKNIIYIPLG